MTARQAGNAAAQLGVGFIVGALTAISAFQAQLSRLDERTALMSVQLAEVRSAVLPRRVASAPGAP